MKTKVKRIPETHHPRRITRATISRRMLLVPILIESRVPYRCVPSQSSPVCVHTFIRHVTESGFSHEPLPRRQDACRLLPGVCFPMIFLQHYRPVLITNALSLHLHFFLNLMTGTLLFSFDTVSTCELNHLAPERGGSSLSSSLVSSYTLFPPDGLSQQESSWISPSIRTTPTRGRFLDDTSLSNRDTT